MKGWILVALLAFLGCSRSNGPTKGPMQFKKSNVKEVEVATTFVYEILGPKEGTSEDLFKASQKEDYRRFPEVQRAYLVSVKHPNETTEVVMLILYPESAMSDRLIAAVRDDLYRVSGGKPPLDVVFVDENEARRAGQKAAPFYENR